jgi:transcriptional regulator with XRE-family HTH domain
MRKTLHSASHRLFLKLLVAARHRAGLTQHTLAKRLERPQSFVAKYENGERRIDIVEFVELAERLGTDPVKLFKEFLVQRGSSSAARKGAKH